MVLPDYYEFYCRSKIVSGNGVLESMPAMMTALVMQKPLLITDTGVVQAGLIELVHKSLGESSMPKVIWDDVPPDSDLTTVNRVAKFFQDNTCDSIIAVGGGSVLDTAKGANIVVSSEGKSLMALAGTGTIQKRLNPLIAIPTTSGTGSEVTMVAVIADHQQQVKLPFLSHYLVPDIAVLDPRMTLSMPPALTAATGMDALTHAVEAYTCLAKNPLCDAYALQAIELIADHLIEVIQEPAHMSARLAMANAACLAGIAFSNAMVGMVHALGHALGAVCHIPHGQCMAVILPYGLEYNLAKNEDLTAELLLPLAGADRYIATPRHLRARAVIDHMRGLNQTLHELTGGRHARRLNEITDSQGNLSVTEDQLESIAAKALDDGSIFYNPEELDFQDALRVLRAAYAGVSLGDR